MRKITILLIVALRFIYSPSATFCQSNGSTIYKKNRISLQTGLFHYFFDGAPILNVNYRESSQGEPRTGVFNQLLISSIGLRYDRSLNKQSRVGIEVTSFRNTYWKHSVTFPDGDFYNPPVPLVYFRSFLTLNIDYLRVIFSSSDFNFITGGGLCYRRGPESIIVNKGLFGPLLESSTKNDIGLNVFGGIEYSPIDWFTIYSKIDFMGLVYLHDKENIKELRSYGNMPNYYPSRFDLSWRFGVGINF